MRRRLLVAAAICSLAAALPLETSALTPTAVSNSAVEDSAERIAACRYKAKIKGYVKVDILFVIDTSMSLRDSDPIGKTVRDPARVRAMESVVSMLRPGTESTVQIRVNFLDFGSKVRASFSNGDWQLIEDFDSSKIKEFATKDDDPDTDYVGALIDPGGVVDILSRAKDESDCQVVLWFTDGKFDFDAKAGLGSREFSWLEAETGSGTVRDRVTALRAREVGERLLCRKGESREYAVADELRFLDKNDALTVIGVGLNTSGQANNFAILQRLLESSDCGAKEPVGYLVEVKSADDLAAAMRKAFFPVVPQPIVCDPRSVTDLPSIYIAEPVERADIFIQSQGKVSEIELIRLGRENEVLSSLTLYKGGSVRSGDLAPGVTVLTTQLDNSPLTLDATVEFSSPTDDWVGQWVLRACNETGSGPAELSADVLIRGCVAFKLAAGDEEVIVDREKKIFLMLTRCGKDASRLSTVERLSLATTLRIGDSKIETILRAGESSIEIPFAPTESDLGGAATKKVKLEVLEVDATYNVLKDSQPVVLEWSKENSVFDLTLRRPPGTPYVEKVACGTLKKSTKSVTCEFKAIATDADGKIFTEGAKIETEASLGSVKITSQLSAKFPLEVRPGQPEQFSLTFSLDGTRKNLESISQPFTIEFSYETDGEPTEQATIESEFIIEPDFGVSPDWRRAFFFAALGLLAALAILALARFIFARIQVPSEGMLWAGCLDIARCDSESARTSLKFDRIDFTALPLSQTRIGLRKVNELAMVGDCNVGLQARAGWRFFSELGFVAASHPEFPVIGADGVLSNGRVGRSSLNLVGQWWLIPQGVIDGAVDTIEEVLARLEEQRGKLVFIAASAEPPQSFLDDLGFAMAGGIPPSLLAVASNVWIRPRAPKDDEGAPSQVNGASAPEI